MSDTASLSMMVQGLPRSGIRAAASLAGDRPGLIHLEYGEPDFMTPEPIRRAAIRALAEERMVYTATEGPGRLREAISCKLRSVNGVQADPDEIFVTHGGVGGLTLAMACLLNPGDGVLVPDPGWPNTVSQCLAFGGVPIPYPLDRANGYLPDPDHWTIPDGVKMIVVNSPSNPTGSVFPRSLSEKIVEVARRRGLWILSDEVYDQIYYDERPTALGTLYPERTVAVYSFSKTYAMTGWRLGYLTAPRTVSEAMKKVAEALYSSTSMIAQKAAQAALEEAGDTIAPMVRSYRERRDRALALLDAWGMRDYTPEGAFYLMVDVSRAGDAETVARRLVLERGVVTVPGSAFGDLCRSALRLSLASGADDIEQGLTAVRDMLLP